MEKKIAVVELSSNARKFLFGSTSDPAEGIEDCRFHIDEVVKLDIEKLSNRGLLAGHLIKRDIVEPLINFIGRCIDKEMEIQQIRYVASQGFMKNLMAKEILTSISSLIKGIHVEFEELSAQREGYLSALSTRNLLNTKESLIHVDVGGKTTEIVFINEGMIGKGFSFPFGYQSIDYDAMKVKSDNFRLVLMTRIAEQKKYISQTLREKLVSLVEDTNNQSVVMLGSGIQNITYKKGNTGSNEYVIRIDLPELIEKQEFYNREFDMITQRAKANGYTEIKMYIKKMIQNDIALFIYLEIVDIFAIKNAHRSKLALRHGVFFEQCE